MFAPVHILGLPSASLKSSLSTRYSLISRELLMNLMSLMTGVPSVETSEILEEEDRLLSQAAAETVIEGSMKPPATLSAK